MAGVTGQGYRSLHFHIAPTTCHIAPASARSDLLRNSGLIMSRGDCSPHQDMYHNWKCQQVKFCTQRWDKKQKRALTKSELKNLWNGLWNSTNRCMLLKLWTVAGFNVGLQVESDVLILTGSLYIDSYNMQQVFIAHQFQKALFYIKPPTPWGAKTTLTV